MQHLLRVCNAVQAAKDEFIKVQQKQQQCANTRRQSETFILGDQVLISTHNYSLNNQEHQPARKLQHWFAGPYLVVEVISPVVYQLRLPDKLRIHPVFHVSQLHRYVDSPREFKTQLEPVPPQVMVTGDVEYEVECVLGRRTRR